MTSAPVVAETVAEVPVAQAVVESATPVSGTQVEDFILPDIGEGIVECELVEWLVAEGDVIEEDQPIADVMTDKALVQIPAMHNGTVVKLYYAKGEIAKVHSPLFAVEIAATGQATTTVVETPKAAPVAQASAPKTTTTKAPVAPANTATAKVVNEKAVASPAVRRVARELNVNIHQVPGSGKKGRVYKEDVVAFNEAPAVSAIPTVAASAVTGGTRVEPIRGVKAAMAKAMVNLYQPFLTLPIVKKLI